MTSEAKKATQIIDELRWLAPRRENAIGVVRFCYEKNMMGLIHEILYFIRQGILFSKRWKG